MLPFPPAAEQASSAKPPQKVQVLQSKNSSESISSRSENNPISPGSPSKKNFVSPMPTREKRISKNFVDVDAWARVKQKWGGVHRRFWQYRSALKCVCPTEILDEDEPTESEQLDSKNGSGANNSFFVFEMSYGELFFVVDEVAKSLKNVLEQNIGIYRRFFGDEETAQSKHKPFVVEDCELEPSSPAFYKRRTNGTTKTNSTGIAEPEVPAFNLHGNVGIIENSTEREENISTIPAVPNADGPFVIVLSFEHSGILSLILQLSVFSLKNCILVFAPCVLKDSTTTDGERENSKNNRVKKFIEIIDSCAPDLILVECPTKVGKKLTAAEKDDKIMSALKSSQKDSLKTLLNSKKRLLAAHKPILGCGNSLKVVDEESTEIHEEEEESVDDIIKREARKDLERRIATLIHYSGNFPNFSTTANVFDAAEKEDKNENSNTTQQTSLNPTIFSKSMIIERCMARVLNEEMTDKSLVLLASDPAKDPTAITDILSTFIAGGCLIIPYRNLEDSFLNLESKTRENEAAGAPDFICSLLLKNDFRLDAKALASFTTPSKKEITSFGGLLRVCGEVSHCRTELEFWKQIADDEVLVCNCMTLSDNFDYNTAGCNVDRNDLLANNESYSFDDVKGKYWRVLRPKNKNNSSILRIMKSGNGEDSQAEDLLCYPNFMDVELLRHQKWEGDESPRNSDAGSD